MGISVITATYNAEQSIRKTLESVIGQREQVLQYIVVDGGSTDRTVEIVKEYSWLEALEVISERDDGIYDAFNKGIGRAKGEIIAIVNAGDWLDPDTLSSVRAEFEKHDIDVLCGVLRYHSELTGSFQYWIPAPERLHREMTIGHPAFFVRAQVYRSKVGLFDKSFRIAGDYDFVARAYVKGMRFGVTSKVVVNMTDGGASWVGWKKSFREASVIRERYFRKSRSYLAFQFIRTRLSRWVARAGLNGLLRLYRRNLAAIPKADTRPTFPTRIVVSHGRSSPND